MTSRRKVVVGRSEEERLRGSFVVWVVFGEREREVCGQAGTSCRAARVSDRP
jgi:hypothetical protein